jgi:hypothetical protein
MHSLWILLAVLKRERNSDDQIIASLFDGARARNALRLEFGGQSIIGNVLSLATSTQSIRQLR